MKQSLELKLGQRLSMTPQLQQAIRFLQLSSAELQTELREAVEANPLLEQSETDTTGTGREAAGDQSPEPVDADGIADEAQVGDDTPLVDRRVSSVATHGSGSDAGNLDARNPMRSTLRDQLLWQLNLTALSRGDREIAETIIGCIDSSGYLGASLDEITSLVNGQEFNGDVDIDEVEAVLHQIQNFEPTGVGARNLRECLLLQLRQSELPPAMLETARALVSDHLERLARRDYKALKKLLNLDNETLQGVISAVKRLNPRPGETTESSSTIYVLPDIVVSKQKGHWKATLNPAVCSELHINQRYRSLLDEEGDGRTLSYVRSQMNEARWVIRSLKNRYETLLRVADAIVHRQQAFFRQGESAMMPLVMRDIAEELDIHESTVSRAATQKYMLTPRGIFELRYFFTSHVDTADGGSCSSAAIQSRIRRLIDDEPPALPISDSRIAAILHKDGINIARRTVAKYRDQMKIPASSRRKGLC